MRARVSSFADRLSAVVPIVACLFCPACLASLGVLLSPLGVRVSLGAGSEWLVTLLGALGLVLVMRAALRAPTRGPLLLALAAAALFASSRALALPEPIELAGLCLLPVSSIWAQLATRGSRAPECECHSHPH